MRASHSQTFVASEMAIASNCATCDSLQTTQAWKTSWPAWISTAIFRFEANSYASHPQKVPKIVFGSLTRALLFRGRITERQMRRDIQHHKNSDYRECEREAMRKQKIQRRVTVQDSKNSFNA